MRRILFLAIIAVVFASCFGDRSQNTKTVQGKELSFILKKRDQDYDIKLKDNDKVVVMNFFATDCGACKEEIPSLNNIKSNFSKNVKVIGIMGNNIKKQEAKKFIDDFSISYDIVSHHKTVNTLSKAVGGVAGVPVTFIFDKNGKRVKRFLGYVPESTIVKAIKNIE